MTEAQATDIVTMIRAACASRVDDDTLAYFGARLMALDHEAALSAATMGVVGWRRFPSWADFNELYQAQRKLRQPSGEQRSRESERQTRGVREIPFWVRRWIAARFLFARWGKERDMRAFPEQEIIVGPPSLVEQVPAGEWNEEAEQVSDKEVWGALKP